MADNIPVGSEIRVNTTTAGEQSGPTITALSDGGWLVTWMAAGQDGSGYGVYQQRYTASGVALGGEIQVNTSTLADQYTPDVTALPDGGWLVTWASWQEFSLQADVYQQRYSSTGDAVDSETRVNTTTTDSQTAPVATALADGGWVVTWHSYNPDGSQGDIYQQRYTSAGAALGGETRVNATIDFNQGDPTVTALPDGGWLVAWTSALQDGSATGVYQQRYSAEGVAVGDETLVNTTILSHQGSPAVTALEDGGWVVTWITNGPTDWGGGVFQQRYTAGGSAVGGEVMVNAASVNSQWSPDVTGLADGGWLVTWYTSQQDGSANVYQQRYTADGLPAGSQTAVTTNGTQAFPAVTALADGGWVITWMSDDGSGADIYQQRFGMGEDGGGGGTPVITSNGGGDNAAITVPENVAAVTTVTGLDPDVFDTLTYSISGGGDAAKFQIDTTTGALSFLASPDFESPADANGDNVYDVIVQVTDGVGIDTQTIAVTVANTNDNAPVFSSGTAVSVAENTADPVYDGDATDADNLAALTYSLSGTDSALFDIDATTGIVTFKSTPDFEAPADADGNNVYDIVVTASDGTLTTDRSVAITLTDASENRAPSFIQDGKVEIAMAVTDGVRVLNLLKDGSVQDTGIYLPSDAYSYRSATGDVDADGDQDILVSGDNGNGRLYLNNGDNTFSDSGARFRASFQADNELVDIDYDGDLDVVIMNLAGSTDVYRNNGSSGFPWFNPSLPDGA